MDEMTMRIKIATATLQELRIGHYADTMEITKEMTEAIDKLKNELTEW
jgi:hypothetical protein